MAYIDCDKCYHGRVCAHRHHYHDMIVECNHHIPTADVVEVKHGKWQLGRRGRTIVCSECETKVPFCKDKYCPNCGAKMDGRRDT